ncbi:retrovirus-related pol polyprotein from transposon TNT 1-94 [Tanacetum coccineum]
MVNESLIAELERYKERVAIFEQRQNVDLNKHEQLIDSQMDDLIRNRNAKFVAFQQEIETLKETLYNNVKEKESLSTTLNFFKTESKEKEPKDIHKEIVLEKQNKELENIISLGYQNLFHLKKAQRIKPTLYDGSVIAKEHDVISVIDDEETLILEEESRSKMLDKQNDQILIKQKINISPIDYSEECSTVIVPISHRLKNTRDAHEVYLEKTIENTDTLRGLELLVYISKTCPSLTKPTEKLVTITPMNKDKKVRPQRPSLGCGIKDYLILTLINHLSAKQTLRATMKKSKSTSVNIRCSLSTMNDVVERQNRTLVEAACTMLIFSKALLFLWAEAVATACYTQNRSLIRKRHNKTPYELFHDRKPNLSYLHVFDALCYPNNDGEDLGKLKPKADIGIFVG